MRIERGKQRLRRFQSSLSARVLALFKSVDRFDIFITTLLFDIVIHIEVERYNIVILYRDVLILFDHQFALEHVAMQ